MESIAFSCTAIPACNELSAISKSYSAAHVSQIGAALTQSKDITIFTDEGDKVTLSYDRRTEAAYTELTASSYSADFSQTADQAAIKASIAGIQGQAFRFEDSQTLTITLDGELNEQELEDIKTALAGIEEIMTKLLQKGDISEAMTEANEIRDLDTIAGIEADYRFEKAVWVSKVEVSEIETYSKYGLPETTGPDSQTNNRGPFTRVADEMENKIKDSHTRPSKFLRHLKRLFGKIHQRLGEEMRTNNAKMNVADLMGDELIKRIRQLSETYETEQTSTAA